MILQFPLITNLLVLHIKTLRIGQGESIMENSYSKYTLQEIKNNLDKFSYDFLQPEFDEWKKIMGKK